MKNRPVYHPIIYVRGYAGTQGAVEDTVATPYMGFNLGATKFRQAYDKEAVEEWVFESPLLRLMKDYGYEDAYADGELKPTGKRPRKSVWIFRYYDDASHQIGIGKRKEIEDYANELREFVQHVLDCTRAKKVYLVAHSMGGLICRCYLQSAKIPDLDGKHRKKNRRTGVDKLFTYATPHGGIEFRPGLRWVSALRDFLKINNSDNFGHDRMKEFLDLDGDDVQSTEERFPTDRVFSLIGTDSRDYGAAAGMSRISVGPMSDGLVQIGNAYVRRSPRAFVHRSHSGHYGIVNSEEAYQSLRRFLFGDLRADLLLTNVQVTLPPNLRRKKNVDTSYYIETVISIRGLPFEVHRRIMSDGGAIHRKDDVITARPTFLYSAFLNSEHMVKPKPRSLGKTGTEVGFLIRVRIVPQYHVEKRLWRDDHFEGNPVFEDSLQFFLQSNSRGPKALFCDFASGPSTQPMPVAFHDETKDGVEMAVGRVPFQWPLISGEFEIRTRRWNDW